MDGFPREGGTGDKTAYVWIEDQVRGDNRREKDKKIDQHTEKVSSRRQLLTSGVLFH